MQENPSYGDIVGALRTGDRARVGQWVAEGSVGAGWRDAAGDTLMHYAASWGAEDLVDFLLERGGKADVFNLSGDAPADTARAFGWPALAATLEARAQNERKSAPQPFPYASLAEIRAAGAQSGENLLEMLARRGLFDRVAGLAEQDPQGIKADDLLAKTARGDSILMIVCMKGQLSCLLSPGLWAARPAEFARVWESVPDCFRKGVDGDGLVAKIRQAGLKRGQHRPKFGPAP